MKINNDFEALVQVLTLAITAETEEQRNKFDPMAYEIAADFDELTIKRARKEALAKAEELIFKEALAKVEEQSEELIFTNAQELKLENPGLSDAPSEEELADLSVGDNVKVCINDLERVWAEVIEINGNEVTATLESSPVLVDLEYGDEIDFKKHDIYSIWHTKQGITGHLDIDDEALNVQFPGAPFKCQLPVFFAHLGNPFKSDSLVSVSASGKADLEQLRVAASEALSESGYHGRFLERTEINGNFIQIIVGS